MNKEPLTVTANNQTVSYGTAITLAGSTQFTSTGLTNGQTIGSVTLAVSGGGSTNETTGAYTITPSAATGGTFVAADYTITYVTNTLTVNPKALTITAKAQTKGYGAVLPTGPGSTQFTSNGLVLAQTIGSVTLTSSGGVATAPVSGSPYTETPSAATGGTFIATNYTISYVTANMTVTNALATVTANHQTTIYGTPITLVGSTQFTSSVLSNSENIGSVTLSVSGPAAGAANEAAGTYGITPSAATGGSGTEANYTITYVTNTLTVNPAALTVTANNLSRPYGATNPVFTVTYTNFVNGETLATSDVGGSPALTTSATTNSDIGAYDITNTLGTLTSTNYMFSFVDGTLTVTNAVSTNVVTASTNIALPGTTVTFTATLSALAPSLAVPTNAVQFLIDSVAFGDPIPLTNGMASITNATLTHGSHVIEVDYTGDTNALGGTNILGSTNTFTEVIDRPPFAGDSTYSRLRGALLEILLSDLHSNTFDPDGDLYTLVVSPTSTNGATIVVTNGLVIYTPPVTNADVADSFTYTVTDSFGLTGTGTVHVTIQPAAPVTITGLSILGDGTSQFSFTGLPYYTYLIQGTADLTPPISWTTLGTNTAGTNGLIQFIDANATNFPNRYYRIFATP